MQQQLDFGLMFSAPLSFIIRVKKQNNICLCLKVELFNYTFRFSSSRDVDADCKWQVHVHVFPGECEISEVCCSRNSYSGQHPHMAHMISIVLSGRISWRGMFPARWKKFTNFIQSCHCSPALAPVLSAPCPMSDWDPDVLFNDRDCILQLTNISTLWSQMGLGHLAAQKHVQSYLLQIIKKDILKMHVGENNITDHCQDSPEKLKLWFW